MNNHHPLKIENINKSFGAHHVLNNINFEVNNGEVFGLIGLNGAGKTTLIKIILGLLKQDSGNVTIFGDSVDVPQTRKHLSFLPEKFHPSPLFKGSEFLSLSLSYYGKKYDHEKAVSLAEKLDLRSDVLKHTMKRYSKGMGQKVGLMSAFLSETPLLILDEPMSGLDPSARISLKQTLDNYVKSGNTIFFSSHILSDIDEICNRIAILHNHQMIYVGTPKQFKELYKIDNLEKAFLKAISQPETQSAAA